MLWIFGGTTTTINERTLYLHTRKYDEQFYLQVNQSGAKKLCILIDLACESCHLSQTQKMSTPTPESTTTTTEHKLA